MNEEFDNLVDNLYSEISTLCDGEDLGVMAEALSELLQDATINSEDDEFVQVTIDNLRSMADYLESGIWKDNGVLH